MATIRGNLAESPSSSRATFWTWLWAVSVLCYRPRSRFVLSCSGGMWSGWLSSMFIFRRRRRLLLRLKIFYQRMLAGDDSEVVDQAERFLKTNSLIDYYDEVRSRLC